VVEAVTLPASMGTFSIRSTRRIAFEDHTIMPLQGRYLFHGEELTVHGEELTAGIAVPVAAGSDPA
jgi:hypothetical protein